MVCLRFIYRTNRLAFSGGSPFPVVDVMKMIPCFVCGPVGAWDQPSDSFLKLSMGLHSIEVNGLGGLFSAKSNAMPSALPVADPYKMYNVAISIESGILLH